MTITIRESDREWSAAEVAALGDIFVNDAPLEDLERVLWSRGYRVLEAGGLGPAVSARVERRTLGVTLGELRAAVAARPGLPDHMPVVVRFDEVVDGISAGAIINAGVDTGCDGEEFFAIEVSADQARVREEDGRRRGC